MHGKVPLQLININTISAGKHLPFQCHPCPISLPLNLNYISCHDKAQAVSRESLTMKTRARAQDSQCRVCVNGSLTGTEFSLSPSAFPFKCYPTTVPYPFIYHLGYAQWTRWRPSSTETLAIHCNIKTTYTLIGRCTVRLRLTPCVTFSNMLILSPRRPSPVHVRFVVDKVAL
jgi:hypothetical protein